MGAPVAALARAREAREFEQMRATMLAPSPDADGSGHSSSATRKGGAASAEAFATAGFSFAGRMARAARSMVVPSARAAPFLLTRMVQAVLDQQAVADEAAPVNLDPLTGADVAQRAAGYPRTRTPYSEATVFVVGGGCYVEYENLMAAVAPRPVTYGSTELLAPEAFLAQMAGTVVPAEAGEL